MTAKIADKHFTLKEVLTYTRVAAALAKNPKNAGRHMTLADMEPYFEEERQKALAKCALEDEIFALLKKEQPEIRSPTGRRNKATTRARQDADQILRRRASCLADTVMRREAGQA